MSSLSVSLMSGMYFAAYIPFSFASAYAVSTFGVAASVNLGTILLIGILFSGVVARGDRWNREGGGSCPGPDNRWEMNGKCQWQITPSRIRSRSGGC